ncbi:hypothetical protein LJK87_26070 [Paenibacillus sp. P25]|nr:hypothetical protein LJK87_26070 [Paenibacillus sp. P25]
MSSTFTPAPANKIFLYFLAGVATAPNFMEGFRRYWSRYFQQNGWETHAELLFPYGDWGRHWSRQLPEAYADLRRRSAAARAAGPGGFRAAEAIAPACGGGELILIGHSAGGLAAVQAAKLLAPGTPASVSCRSDRRGAPFRRSSRTPSCTCTR